VLEQEPALRMMLMHCGDTHAPSRGSSSSSSSSHKVGGSNRGVELPAASAPADAESAIGVQCRLFPRQLEYVVGYQEQQQKEQQQQRKERSLFKMDKCGGGVYKWYPQRPTSNAALEVLRFTEWGFASSAWGLSAAQQQRLSSRGELVVPIMTRDLNESKPKERGKARQSFEDDCKERSKLLIKVEPAERFPLVIYVVIQCIISPMCSLFTCKMKFLGRVLCEACMHAQGCPP
jgi:hypothetical protein